MQSFLQKMCSIWFRNVPPGSETGDATREIERSTRTKFAFWSRWYIFLAGLVVTAIAVIDTTIILFLLARAE